MKWYVKYILVSFFLLLVGAIGIYFVVDSSNDNNYDVDGDEVIFIADE